MDKSEATYVALLSQRTHSDNRQNYDAACHSFSLKNCNNNTHALTFLKCNYKYKRRCDAAGSHMQRHCSGAEARDASARSESNGGHTDAQAQPQTNARRESGNNLEVSVILRLFIVIISKLMQRHIKVVVQQWRHVESVVANDQPVVDAIAAVATEVGVGGSVDSDVINYQQNYDNVSTTTTTTTAASERPESYGTTRSSWQAASTSASASASAALSTPQTPAATTATSAAGVNRQRRRHRHHQQQQQQRQLKALSMFMTLFMALALWPRRAEAGVCWLSAEKSGKCSGQATSQNSTRAECCSSNHQFSYTDRELSSIEFFFASRIGSVECAPCMDSCAQANCGPNKKCVKRRGRPKCICAPECGDAVRRQQQQRGERLYRGHQHHSEQWRGVEGSGAVDDWVKSPRDIRSLSSEITNINLGLDVDDQHHQQQQQQQQQQQENKNQRKIIIMQSQSQQKPQISKREPKPRRLLIDANVKQEEEKPTTRRLQIISNVRGGAGGSHRRRTNDNDSGNNSGVDDVDARAKSAAESGGGAALSRHRQQHEHKKHKSKSGNNNAQGSNDLALSKQQQQHHEQTSHNRKQQRHRNHRQHEQQHQQHQRQHQNQQQQQHHNRNNTTRVRHIYQHNGRAAEYDVPPQQQIDDAVKGNKHQARHRKQHNRSKQKKLKDPYANASADGGDGGSTNSAAAADTAISSSSSAATTIRTALQTAATTAANFTSSADRRAHLYNHGSSNVATSLSSSATIAAGGKPVNADDLTFLDGIYDKYGFPSTAQQPSVTHFAATHHTPHPVCGTDGRTYNTECQLKKRACRTDNANLQVAYRGHCKTSCSGVKCLNGLTCVEDHYTIPHCIACRIECPQDEADNDDADDHDAVAAGGGSVIAASRAVCGVDGKTYKSTCDINRMICKIGRAIAVAYPGPCRADHVTCGDINCGPKHTCLVDLLTHEPRCVSCRYKCARKQRPTSLRFEEGKICGVNKRTYNSWCEMRRDSCSTGFFIDVKSPGECQ